MKTGFIVATMVLMFGCVAQPRMEKPVDFFAVAYASVKAAAKTIGQRSKAGAIDAVTKNNLLDDLQTAKDSLDLGKAALGSGDSKTALGWLAKAQQILTAVEERLRNEQPSSNNRYNQFPRHALG